MNIKQQLLFWFSVLVILVLIFGLANGNFVHAFYFVCMLLPVAVGTSWYFNEVLVPRYLLYGRYVKFGLYFIYAMIISLWLEIIIMTLSLIILAKYDIEKMNPLTTNVASLGFVLYLVVFIQAFIQFFHELQYAKKELEVYNRVREERSSKYLLIRADRKYRQLLMDDILYIESLSDYLKIFVKGNECIITRETISKISNRLSDDYIRIHRSFIVSKKEIRSFNKEELWMGARKLPIGRTYKQVVMKIIKPNQDEVNANLF